MKSSARNTIKGIVKTIEMGSVNTVVTLEVAPGVEISGMITKESAESLALSLDKEAYAIIKASEKE